jgi:PIN domain nuclease of toxin-antitoxin system
VNLLLDTHALVWAESASAKLGQTSRSPLDKANALWVSPISTFELARLIAPGRLSLNKPLMAWLDGARGHLGFQDAVFSHAIAAAAYQLPGELHKDPADRILVATAREHGHVLLTADEMLLGYPHVATFDVRR